MYRKSGIALLVAGGLLTALNAAVLILQLSASSSAAVGGMNAQSLANDTDFQSAVKTVVEGCRVNVDIGKVQCPPYK
ncbi:MAG: hypothetical protein AB7S93_05200 [Xanthobacteraceae bacterium]|jgi:hypothetical protein